MPHLKIFLASIITFLAPTAIRQNGKIVFTNNKDGNVEIYIMNADGGGQVRLTNNVAFDGDPAVSPDGARIAFTSTRDGNEEIYVISRIPTGRLMDQRSLAASRSFRTACLVHTEYWS